MRLRLRIERNELPPVQVLHAIPPTQQSQTISQFLQSINALFPLESTTWDISDYSVLVAGYEATHYTEVGQAFKDEDEVVIKPLGFAELRARTLSGRDQISEDGRHLLDGVPFGRPMLKRPRRPEVNIPARKRQKTDDAVDAQALVRLENDEEDDEEDDEDFEIVEVEGEGDDEDADESDGEDSSDDDSSADDSSPDGSASSSDDSSESDSGSSSESESEASWDGVEEKVSNAAEAPKSNGIPAPKLEQGQALPNEGQARTRERNHRKRDSKKLKHLKEAGLLPQQATLQDMHNWQQEKGLDDSGAVMAGQKAKMESERKRLLEQIASGGIDIASSIAASGEDDEPPEERSSRPSARETVDIDEAMSSDAASTQIITEAQQAAEVTPIKAKTKRGAEADDADHSSASKRARLDTRSMNRLVFGSLGLRTPKTQEERAALQKKLSVRTTRASAAAAFSEPAVERLPEAEEDSDSWREKVVLTAVECVDENVELSEPPFPFQQRWDPQYQFTAKRKRSKGRKSNAKANDEFVETYDKYNQNGGGDALDYDDPKDDDEGDDSYWEEGALLDNGDEAEDDSDDGFPPLPVDHAALPSLAESDAKSGDYITYQELAVSAATSWEPKLVSQIARLETKTDDGSWTVVLKQNRPKEYDESGNRVYTKFEMEDFSDDGNDTEPTILSWAALQNPKLLLRSVDTVGS
ncbi:hypothetical protein CERZMDRAFT_81827 [Cercospora zeae-maydis SCOH1-5]|uniref:DUF7357 domain-containing protein n=1 Tax=Cercospora zeae-maydis SCOH1-5 TaxID=717836 RepID=A0A6A6FQN9_9PEZI|nr:hypothetical protein CERZMDRAFT_81827 [Cercospora zeae-maydis SCOH1-5]